tara:strand:+ start:49 stop:549 length:501 start_codon:yes stop_codon:yes gene_type:complete
MHKYGSIRMVARRGELPAGSPARAPDASFLRKLKAVDPLLELYWHPIRQGWVAYRLVKPQPARSDDLLVSVGDVPALNDTYIQWLHSNDMGKKYGTNGMRAAMLQDQMLMTEEYERDRAAEREKENLLDEMKKDVTMCKNERTSFSSAVFESENKKAKRNPAHGVL